MSLFYFIKIVLSLCSAFDGRRESCNRSKTHNLKYKGKPVNTEDIREFE